MNIKVPALSQKALNKLYNYDYPGNIRELKNIIQRLLLFCQKGTIDEEDILIEADYGSLSNLDNLNLDLEEHEKILIHTALKRSDNVISNAAKLLGISPFALARRLKKYNMHPANE